MNQAVATLQIGDLVLTTTDETCVRQLYGLIVTSRGGRQLAEEFADVRIGPAIKAADAA
jgi:hypothetical protein